MHSLRYQADRRDFRPLSLRRARDSKRKRSSGSVIGGCPQTTVMSLNNRAAHMQPDSHPIVFRCIERFEKFVRSFRLETNSSIFHAQAHPIALFPFGSDKQLSRAVGNCSHRVRSISKQI